MMDQPWHVLHVVANHEKRIGEHLANRRFEHYLPLCTYPSRWTDRTVKVQRPLFPGYLFVRLEPQNNLTVLRIPGVLKMLGSGNNGAVADAEIERIRTAILGGYLLQPHPRVEIGTHVRIRCGIFAGVEGIVAEFHGLCKVVVALSIANSYFSLETKIDDVEVLTADGSSADGSFVARLN